MMSNTENTYVCSTENQIRWNYDVSYKFYFKYKLYTSWIPVAMKRTWRKLTDSLKQAQTGYNYVFRSALH